MFIPGIVVGALGLMFILGSFKYWPIILVAVGLVIVISVLARYFYRRRREEDKEI
jgi:membrane protein implicated in regulation of membrane protease activity